MNNNLKIVLGTVAGAMIGGLTVVGANQAIQAIQTTGIKVNLNGQLQEFKDETTGETQYPITYHDRTYLPLRNVENIAGLNVDYESKTNTAMLNKNVSESYVTNYTSANWDGIQIADMGNNMISIEYYAVSSAPYYRIAGFTVYDVKISPDGQGSFIIESDAWGHAGAGKILLKNDKLEMEIFDMHDKDPEIAKDALWGIFDGHFEFNKIENSNNIDLFKGKAYDTETTNVYNIAGKNYWYYNITSGTEQFGKYYIDGLDGKYVSRAIFFEGPQILSSGKLAMICDNDLYIAEWKEAEIQNENGQWTIPDTIYAKKVETKGKVLSILHTSYDTGDVLKGTENYLMIIYEDGTFEEMDVLNNRMAS